MDGIRSAIAHLYRRAGFGARPDELDQATAAGYGATVARLVALSPPDPGADKVALPTLTPLPSSTPPKGAGRVAEKKALFRKLAPEERALELWWLQRMAAATNPLSEKVTLLMHNQFPTSVAKVHYPALMHAQNQLFRTLGAGSFEVLTQAVAKDPAMLIWLDAGTDKAAHPNENFARELMERFTMGLGSYTESDVREGARCFTGWVLDRATGAWAERPAQHDNGVKTYLGHTGNLDGEQAITIATHTPASARWVVSRMWGFLAYPVTTSDPVVSDLVPGYVASLSIGSLLGAIFAHPQFISSTARTGLVKQPIEYVVGAMRALRLPLTSPRLLGVLAGLGQVPFAPPSVGGWPGSSYWLSTAAALTRLRFAQEVAAQADLSAVADEAPSARAEAVANLLSVDGWSPTTTSALSSVAGNPASLVALALVSPEYVVN